MPAPMTDMQKAFSVEYAINGGNATAAAKVAGYSVKTAHEIGRQLLQKPHVKELVSRQLAGLQTRSGAIGLHALVEICKDATAPANARVSAAKALCEHAGLIESAKVARDPEMAVPVNENLVNAREVLATFARFGGYDVKAALQ